MLIKTRNFLGANGRVQSICLVPRKMLTIPAILPIHIIIIVTAILPIYTIIIIIIILLLIIIIRTIPCCSIFLSLDFCC